MRSLWEAIGEDTGRIAQKRKSPSRENALLPGLGMVLLLVASRFTLKTADSVVHGKDGRGFPVVRRSKVLVTPLPLGHNVQQSAPDVLM